MLHIVHKMNNELAYFTYCGSSKTIAKEPGVPTSPRNALVICFYHYPIGQLRRRNHCEKVSDFCVFQLLDHIRNFFIVSTGADFPSFDA